MSQQGFFPQKRFDSRLPQLRSKTYIDRDNLFKGRTRRKQIYIKERETERDRQKDIETERQADTETETETDIQTDTESDTETDRSTDRQADRQTGVFVDTNLRQFWV